MELKIVETSLFRSAKIPSSKTIFMNFRIVTVKVLNSYEGMTEKSRRKGTKGNGRS